MSRGSSPGRWVVIQTRAPSPVAGLDPGVLVVIDPVGDRRRVDALVSGPEGGEVLGLAVVVSTNSGLS